MSWYKPYELRMAQGLTVQNTYTKLRKGSKKAVRSGMEQYHILANPP